MPGKQCNFKWWLPLLLLAIITPFTGSLDLAISRYFYTNHFQSNPWFDFIYNDGILPAWLTVIASLVVLIGSQWIHPWKQWRRAAWVLILTLAIGSGLLVHLMLKDHWGRPRPKQVIEFGGSQAFRPYYEPNFFHQPEPSKSFPCGHCTMGFYFFSLALIGRCHQSKKVYYGGMILAWSLGILLGWARIAQGGHFFSDVFVSAVIMWITALVLMKFLYYPYEREHSLCQG